MMKLLYLFKRVDIALAIVVATLLVILVPYVLIKGYFSTPEHLLMLKSKLRNDKIIFSRIGDYRGFTIKFSKKELSQGDTSRFEVIVIGRCDSAYAKVSGYYYNLNKKIYFVEEDTVIKNSCN